MIGQWGPCQEAVQSCADHERCEKKDHGVEPGKARLPGIGKMLGRGFFVLSDQVQGEGDIQGELEEYNGGANRDRPMETMFECVLDQAFLCLPGPGIVNAFSDQEEQHKGHEMEPAFGGEGKILFQHRPGIQIKERPEKQRDTTTPSRQGGAGSVGTTHQQEYVEQVEGDGKEKYAQQPMAGPFAFLLGEQEGAQEEQLENDQYKEDAGEIDCHALCKLSHSDLFYKESFFVELGNDIDIHDVADDGPASLKRLIPLQAEVPAVELARDDKPRLYEMEAVRLR